MPDVLIRDRLFQTPKKAQRGLEFWSQTDWACLLALQSQQLLSVISVSLNLNLSLICDEAGKPAQRFAVWSAALITPKHLWALCRLL